MKALDASWQAWISENIARGCSHESMLAVMIDSGFEASLAEAELARMLGTEPGSDIAGANNQASSAAELTESYEYDMAPLGPGNHIDVGDRVVNVVMRCGRPQIIVFANLLSNQECDELIARAQAKLTRSATTDPDTGANMIHPARTSQGMYFHRGEDEFITRIEQRLARLMNLPVENGEGLQVLHYGPGGEYRPHHDYFPPDRAGSAKHTESGGQRVSTLIMYLNQVEQGGETIFPDAAMAVSPQKGAAVYFRYCNAKGQIDPLCLHGGAPVLAGEKWIMTKWVRQRAYVSRGTT